MSRSLTVKIFITFLISFISITFITILVFIFYTNYHYEVDVIDKNVEAMNQFLEQFEENKWTVEQLDAALLQYNQKNATNLVVVSDEFIFNQTNEEYYSIVESYILKQGEAGYAFEMEANQEAYYMILGQKDYNELLHRYDLIDGTSLMVDGLKDGYNFVIPKKIEAVTITWAHDVINLLNRSKLQPITLRCQIKDIRRVENIFEERFTSSNYVPTSEPAAAIKYKYQAGVGYYTQLHPSTKVKYMNFSRWARINGRIYNISASVSLQPVNEMIAIFVKNIPLYSMYIVILAFMIAFIYSRTVAGPIVNLTKMAGLITENRFYNRLPIERDDEIGELAKALDKMSIQIKHNMEELEKSNQQLVRDMRLKEKQEVARKNFVANASHELKTPLGVIKSYSEAIKDGVKVEKQTYYIDVILDEIVHMDRLIQEMLQLSKLDADGVIYHFEKVDMDEVVSRIVESLTASTVENEMRFEIKKPLGEVIADPDKIYQVVMNLIDNAIKYGDKGSAIMIDRIYGEQQIEYYFYNKCPRFAEEDLEKVWNRFYKRDISHTRKIEGSGLGLSIVKSILQGHDAKYGIYNTRDGICIYFILPRALDEEE